MPPAEDDVPERFDTAFLCMCPRENQREFHRVNVTIPFECRRLSDAELAQRAVSRESNICPAQKTCLNLSGGGVAFESKEPCPIGEHVEMRMSLPMDPPVSLAAYGMVLRCEPLSGAYRIVVKFDRMHDGLTGLICRFLFEEERARVQVRELDE